MSSLELDARINELVEASKGMYPDTPDWFVRLAVEQYIREEEPHLLDETDKVSAESNDEAGEH